MQRHVTNGFPQQRPVIQNFDSSFVVCLDVIFEQSVQQPMIFDTPTPMLWHFIVLRSSNQYHGRSLWKFSKRLDKWELMDQRDLVRLDFTTSFWGISYIATAFPLLTSIPKRDDSRLAPSQWETSLQSNAVSHWLGANLESAPTKMQRSIKQGNSALFPAVPGNGAAGIIC